MSKLARFSTLEELALFF
jgi:hypothetical protein